MRILVFGDSIVQGFHDTECGGWVNRLHSYTMNKAMDSDFDYDVTVFNQGISGDCTNGLLQRFDHEAKSRLEGREGAVVFSIGVNDTQRFVKDSSYKTTPEQYGENIRELIAQARTYTDKIFIFGILPIVESMVQPMPWAEDRSHYEEDIVEFDQILKEVCEDVTYTYMQDVFGDDREKYLRDGIHPDTVGHQLIYQRIKTALEAEGII